MHYLWYDCETGGFDPKEHSLLTAYFAVCNQDLVIIDDLYLQLKPEDIQQLNVTPKALEVNSINLQQHLEDSNTITYSEGKERLLALLERNKIKRKRRHYRPCGHNIDFDNGFIFEQLLSDKEWDSYVHYHQLDTTNVTTFLQDVGVLPSDLNTKLTGLVEYFNIPEIDAHNAMGDIKMNIEVYRRMKSMIADMKKNNIGTSSNNLLKIVED